MLNIIKLKYKNENLYFIKNTISSNEFEIVGNVSGYTDREKALAMMQELSELDCHCPFVDDNIDLFEPAEEESIFE